jgi:predicted NAD/FAD-binding protein
VRSIRRSEDHVQLRVGDGVERFDRVVLATHADQALALLEDPTPDEQRVLGRFAYTTNEAVLHTDSRLLPRTPAARASWNYRLGGDGRPTITYHLNRLQGLESERDYCVTLNEDVPEEHVLQRFTYEHPLYTVETLRAQRALPRLAGRRTHYAGAYFGNGFHEDGLASGIAIARELGADW